MPKYQLSQWQFHSSCYFHMKNIAVILNFHFFSYPKWAEEMEKRNKNKKAKSIQNKARKGKRNRKTNYVSN